MPIRRTYGGEAVAKAAQAAGASKAQQESNRAKQQARSQADAQKAALRRQREQQAYSQLVRRQDMMMDLELRKQTKQWEIDKMVIRSRLDFERDEKERQRKLGIIDSKLAQLEKERESGRFGTDEAAYAKAVSYYNAQKEFILTGTKPPTQQQRYGVAPYWQAGKDAPAGTPERMLYEAKMAQMLSPQRTGSIPAYLDPNYLRTLPRDVAEQLLMSHDIVFNKPEQLDEFVGGQQQPTQQAQPTPEELRQRNTREAYELGKQLGYWK